ncbi:MAG: UvrD-helicase domain-containing protein [Anaerolineales bacterium]
MRMDLPDLTEKQRQAAGAKGHDVLVTAGAGSGKTRTLVARYMSLLEGGVSPRQILAITFTEKAAREMRNRVRAAVQSQVKEAKDEERRTDWSGLGSRMDAARIGTIHSFCAEVLRAHPAQAGVDPEFEVIEEGTAAMLLQEAVEETLAWAAQNPGLVPLFSSFSPMVLSQVLSFLLKRRLEVARALESGSGKETGRLAVHSALAAWVTSAEVSGCIQELTLLAERGTLAEEAGLKLAEQVGALLQDWQAMQATLSSGDPLATAARLFALRRDRMALNVGKRDSRAKAGLSRLRELYEGQLGPWLGGSKSDDRPPDAAAETRLAQDFPRMAALFHQAEQSYRQSLDEKSALDFDDLEQKALRLLEDPEIRQEWQGQFSAVLVDEFQDTNDRQRAIINALWGETPGRLFVVGDARQSIYRFRGADVTVFRKMGKSIESRGGETIELGLTFRAHQELLAVLDQLVPAIMGEGEDPGRLYAVAYTPLTAYRSEPRAGVSSPFVEFILGAGADADAARPWAAQALVRRLCELRSVGQIQAWDDVALLFRASTGFAFYEDALEDAGLPFVTVAGRGFYDRPEVRDLLNILQALANPWDDLALAGLLRSPAFGMTDAGLYRLRFHGKSLRPIRDALRTDLQALDSDDQAAAKCAGEFLEALTPLVDRLPVAELLKKTIDLADYRTALASGHHRYWRNIDKLLADAHASRLVRVRTFLDYVRTLRDVGAREGEAPVEEEGAIRLMTIHKAKGLEFPVVALADASRQERNTGEAAYLLAETGLVFRPDRSEAPSLEYRFGRWLDRDQAEAEEGRLLYVAATRAKEKLIVSGHATGSSGDWKATGWLGSLMAAAGYDLSEVIDSPGKWSPARLENGALVGALAYPQGTPDQAARDQQAAETWPDAERVPLYRPLVEPTAETSLAELEEEPRRDWRATGGRIHAPAAVVGSMVHRAIECWSFAGDPGFEKLMQVVALEEGLVEERQKREALARAERLLGRLRAHPVWAEISASAEQHHEVPYEMPLPDGRVEVGVIDLLYRRGAEWVLLDFKIDELVDEASAEAATARYRSQMERYTRAARARLGVKVKARLCYLDCMGEIRIVPL